MPTTTAIVLAAGQGTRMKSPLPKVLHLLAGRPMIHYPVRAALDAGASEVVVVVGHGADQVESYLAAAFGPRVRTALQTEQRGTGHAVRAALPALDADRETTFILYGDTPLLESSDLRPLALELERKSSVDLALLTCQVTDPTGYGRVLRGDDGRVRSICEHRDLTSDRDRAVREINPGMYLARVSFLRRAVAGLSPSNSQNELYLTDIVAAAASGGGVASVELDAAKLVGVNDRAQLAAAESSLFGRVRERLGQKGVTVHGEPFVDDTVEVREGASISHGAVLRGATIIESGASVDVGSVITDSTIGEGALIKPYSVVTSSTIAAKAEVGPFSHLRPGSEIGEGAHVGNFVETKKTKMGRGAKANHLAYLGDGEIGDGANIGAGTIFCNYDGFDKHRTVIGKAVFIGSDSQIVAPVTIGDGAYVATGTTVTEDVPEDAMAIGRARQTNKPGYAKTLRSKLGARAATAKAKKPI